jgi:ubiquinone/menaquinone biosynthesis C-methylase UbiE
MKSSFLEADTEAFYDQQDSLYQNFWDKEGSLHWGYFDQLTSPKPADFITACQHWNEYMLQQSGINAESKVLDIGCGNGNTAIWLAQQTGCQVTGIDLSIVRVENAQEKATKHPGLQINFEKATATDLPFEAETFTHVWSQATLYHVHDRQQALAEVQRVLVEKGVFVFDDLTTPCETINPQAQEYVYSRLMFGKTYSMPAYKQCLSELGIMVLESQDLSAHLLQSYTLLSQLAQTEYPKLSFAYDRMCESITDQQVGWSFYLGQKISDTLAWVYDDEDADKIGQKYDAWAGLYDQQLNKKYRLSPQKSAELLATVLPNKHSTILDVGAGTGMVGEALAALGYDNISALDMSLNMLKEAEKKQIYCQLLQQDLAHDLSHLGTACFDALIAVGVFTYNHAPVAALERLSALLKNRGYIVLTVRDDYFKQADQLQTIFAALSWSIVEQHSFCIFENESVTSLLLQKQPSKETPNVTD